MCRNLIPNIESIDSKCMIFILDYVLYVLYTSSVKYLTSVVRSYYNHKKG